MAECPYCAYGLRLLGVQQLVCESNQQTGNGNSVNSFQNWTNTQDQKTEVNVEYWGSFSSMKECSFCQGRVLFLQWTMLNYYCKNIYLRSYFHNSVKEILQLQSNEIRKWKGKMGFSILRLHILIMLFS